MTSMEKVVGEKTKKVCEIKGAIFIIQTFWTFRQNGKWKIWNNGRIWKRPYSSHQLAREGVIKFLGRKAFIKLPFQDRVNLMAKHRSKIAALKRDERGPDFRLRAEQEEE